MIDQPEGARVWAFEQSWGTRYWFVCPGCGTGHVFDVRTDGGSPSWQFVNGDVTAPTFHPSLNYPNRPRCHLWLRAGSVTFLDDCDHDLAGQTVPLEAIETPQGNPP